MKKNYFGKNVAISGGLLPIAAGFMLMPSFLFAQNKEQIKYIRSQSDLVKVNKLLKNFSKNTFTIQQLMKKAKDKGIPFSGELNGSFYQLKGFDKKGMPLYYVTTNAGASVGTSTDKLNSKQGPFNLNGEGMKVHEWDGGGVLVTHREFEGRVTQKDTPRSSSNHSTHVAGTMVGAGINPQARGMAPKASLDAYEWTNDETEMLKAGQDGALVSNHSYGFTGGFTYGDYAGVNGWYWLGADEDTEYKLYGKYTKSDQEWDLIAEALPMYLPVRAAGNPRGDGPEPGGLHYARILEGGKYVWKPSTKVRQKNGGVLGYDCINQGALGKNVLVVGAAHKIVNGYKKPSDVKMASFSAFGPVDDGRIKPDISGIGVGLYSAYVNHDRAYGDLSGTSMASPNVTGSLILLQEHYSKLNESRFMKAATLKALVIHTANEAGEHPGPDYASGWGLLNAHRAATTISVNGKYSLIEEKKLQNKKQDMISVVASGKEPLVVTIAWTDPAPMQLSGENALNDRQTKALVNDLDIRVSSDDGKIFLPWRLNPETPAAAATTGDNVVDNVEQIVISNPTPGATYKITISHKGDLKKTGIENEKPILVDSNEQDYSLVVTGIGNVSKDLVLNKIEIQVPNTEYTTKTPVAFEILNNGTKPAKGGKISYKVVNGANNDEEFSRGSIDFTEEIAPNAILSKVAEIDISVPFVDYKIIGNVEFQEDEVLVNNITEITAHNTTVDLRPDNTSHKFGFEKDFIKSGWVSEDKDADGRTWIKYDDPTFAKQGSSFAINFPNKNTDKAGGTDDWLFSNPIKIKANTLYRVSLDSRRFQLTNEHFSIHMGTDPNSAAMTTEIASKVDALGKGYKHHYYEFRSTEDKTVYIGFNHKIPKTDKTYAIGLDEVKFEHAEGLPVVDFEVSKINPNTFETVSFVNNSMVASTQPVTKTEWVFEPATVTYMEGTNAQSKEPKVVFNQEGTYAVTLKVTNSVGEVAETKTGYITARNKPTKADFKTSINTIFEGEQVTFTSTSTGNPEPTEFKWTITPSDGIEYVSENTTSPTLVAKFKKSGVYSVSLMAKSLNNESTKVKDNLITVQSLHGAVRALKGSFDEPTKKNIVSWERPVLLPLYVQDFESKNSNMTSIDEDKDGKTWTINLLPANIAPSGYTHSGRGVAVSHAFNKVFKSIDVNNWLLTNRMPAGGEVLKFWKSSVKKERFSVYIIPIPENNEKLTLEKIKAGHKVFTDFTRDFSYKEYVVDISQYTGKDFVLAFLHHSTKEDNGIFLKLDDIEIGYKNDSTTTTPPSNGTSEVKPADSEVVEVYNEEYFALDGKAESNTIPENNTSNSASKYPKLLGYKVYKNGQQINNITDINHKTFSEGVTTDGLYAYDVYAVYSDGVKSKKRNVTIDVTTLSTSDVKGNSALNIYPNPSDGKFIIEAKSGVSSLKAEVYDMSGKLIFKNEFKGNKADLNLTQYSKGVYILNLTDSKGEKYSAKLMIK